MMASSSSSHFVSILNSHCCVVWLCLIICCVCECVWMSECRFLVGCMVPTVVKIRKNERRNEEEESYSSSTPFPPLLPPPFSLSRPYCRLCLSQSCILFYMSFLGTLRYKKKRENTQTASSILLLLFKPNASELLPPSHRIAPLLYIGRYHITIIHTHTAETAETADLLLYSDRSSAAVKSFCMTYDFLCCSPTSSPPRNPLFL